MNRTVAFLLAGGQGTRLSILAKHRAKPAVPFGGIYRIIDFALSNAMNSGVTRVGILTQYRPASLMDHVGDGASWDLFGSRRSARILPPFQGFRDKDWYRGTADAVHRNASFAKKFDPSQVLILSGDHIFHMDLKDMVSFHREMQADLTIATMRVPMEEAHRFGLAIVDGTFRIQGFEEKPVRPQSDLASMGIYVFELDALLAVLHAAIPQGGFDFGQDIIPSMLGRYRLCAYPFDGYWRDVGTLYTYWQTHMDLFSPDSHLDLRSWSIRTNLGIQGILDRPPARILPSGGVVQSILAPGCLVEGTVSRSVLFPGVYVGPGATVSDSVLMHDTIIEAGSNVHRSIIDKRCRVGADSQIGVGPQDVPNETVPHLLTCGLIVIGEDAKLPDSAWVGYNTMVEPDVDLSQSPGIRIDPGRTIKLQP